MATKDPASQKAAAARKAAADLRAKQRAAARRTTILSTVGAFALVAVFVVIVLFIVKGGGASGPYGVYDNGVLKAPSAADETYGILVTADGVAGGTPPDGAVRVDLYEDPNCDICKTLMESTSEEMSLLRDEGAVALYFHPVIFIDRFSAGTHYSTRAVDAWVTVAEYDPEQFWLFVEAMYVNKPVEGEKGLTNDEIADVARGAGVSEEAIAKIADGEFTQWSNAGTSQASVDGVSGTPTIWIAGVEQPHFYFTAVPGVLTYDILVVAQGGAEALATIAAERDRALNTGATADGYSEEGYAALQALLVEQVTALRDSVNPTPSPSV